MCGWERGGGGGKKCVSERWNFRLKWMIVKVICQFVHNTCPAHPKKESLFKYKTKIFFSFFLILRRGSMSISLFVRSLLDLRGFFAKSTIFEARKIGTIWLNKSEIWIQTLSMQSLGIVEWCLNGILGQSPKYHALIMPSLWSCTLKFSGKPWTH